jgi:hypothetical protein
VRAKIEKQLSKGPRPDCVTFVHWRFSRTDVAGWMSHAAASTPLPDPPFEGYIQTSSVIDLGAGGSGAASIAGRVLDLAWVLPVPPLLLDTGTAGNAVESAEATGAAGAASIPRRSASSSIFHGYSGWPTTSACIRSASIVLEIVQQGQAPASLAENH